MSRRAIARIERELQKRLEASVQNLRAGTLTEAQLVEAERLRRALNLAQSLPSFHVRYLAMIAVVLALPLVSLVRLRNTRVDLELDASKVTTVLDRDTRLFPEAGVPIKTLVVQNAEWSPIAACGGVTAGKGTFTLESPSGQSTFDKIVLPANVEAELRQDSNHPAMVELRLTNWKAPSRTLTLTAAGSVVLSAGRETRTCALSIPVPLTLALSPQEPPAAVTIALASEGTTKFFEQAHTQSLSFDDANADTLRRSHVLAGSVDLVDVPGKTYRLHEAEPLALHGSGGILVRSVRQADGKLSVRATGILDKVDVGSDDDRRSFLPRYAEYWKTRDALAIYLAAAVYLAGILWSLLSWWRGRAR